MGCQPGLGLYGGMAYAPAVVSQVHTNGMGMYGTSMYGAAVMGAGALAVSRPYGSYSYMSSFY